MLKISEVLKTISDAFGAEDPEAKAVAVGKLNEQIAEVEQLEAEEGSPAADEQTDPKKPPENDQSL